VVAWCGAKVLVGRAEVLVFGCSSVSKAFRATVWYILGLGE
jgi:hypothetical protein